MKKKRDNIKRDSIANELSEIAPSLAKLKDEENADRLSASEAARLKSAILSKTVGQTTDTAVGKTTSQTVGRTISKPTTSKPSIGRTAELTVKRRSTSKIRSLIMTGFAIAAALTVFLVVRGLQTGNEGAVVPLAEEVTFDSEFDRMLAELSDDELQAILVEEADGYSLEYLTEELGTEAAAMDWSLLDGATDLFELIDTDDFSDEEMGLFL